MPLPRTSGRLSADGGIGHGFRSASRARGSRTARLRNSAARTRPPSYVTRWQSRWRHQGAQRVEHGWPAGWCLPSFLGVAAPDRWSQWLGGRRDAGDGRQRRVSLDRLTAIRDRVKSQVHLGPRDPLRSSGSLRLRYYYGDDGTSYAGIVRRTLDRELAGRRWPASLQWRPSATRRHRSASRRRASRFPGGWAVSSSAAFTPAQLFRRLSSCYR